MQRGTVVIKRHNIKAKKPHLRIWIWAISETREKSASVEMEQMCVAHSFSISLWAEKPQQ